MLIFWTGTESLPGHPTIAEESFISGRTFPPALAGSLRSGSAFAVAAALSLAGLCSAADPVSATPPDANTADARAAAIVDAMTLEEQISLLRPAFGMTRAALGTISDWIPTWILSLVLKPVDGAIGSAAYAPGIARLGWPDLQESDAGLGVANMGGMLRPGDAATAHPASLALAASFDPELARRSGEAIGEEAHAKGFNVQLAGGVNLARDPRNGRNFEYAGEDPLLAGKIAGAEIAGIQSRHVVSTVKHFAMNDQETGRSIVDVRIGEAAMRESDLLAFQIAIMQGHPGSVMCSYNKVNSLYACENTFLLDTVLKHDWGYPGWVMSDWGAVHSLQAAVIAGLDQESPQAGSKNWFGGLAAAVAHSEIPRARVRDMAFRIVRSLIAAGAFDDPARPGGAIDIDSHAATAQQAEEAGMVLLKNEGVLPLAPAAGHIVLIGGHADKWVLSGGGSSQVSPYGGLQHDGAPKGFDRLKVSGYIPSSPLTALKEALPAQAIAYDDGADPERAAAAAKRADLAIVFVEKMQMETEDAADLSLPEHQDELIAKVAVANPHTVVVLETGNPVLMPWLDSVDAVVEAWYPGQRGGEAIAAVLSGKHAPSGRLPITFPRSLAQLPRPKLDGFDGRHAPTGLLSYLTSKPPTPFAVSYTEGADVGYRWFERSSAEPLFPFGFGLTYTRFAYSDLKVTGGNSLAVKVKIENAGDRAGVEVAQLYVAPPGRTHRLAGWSRIELGPHQSQVVDISADPHLLASYDETSKSWGRTAGVYDVIVGPAAGRPSLKAEVTLTAEAGQGEADVETAR
jgi:beta-glucosidase